MNQTLTNEQIVELFKSAISTSMEGQISPQQVREFIDMTIEATGVLQEIRVETDIVKSLELFPWALGDPAMVLASEGTAPADADVVTPTISKKTLTPVEVLLAFDLTFSYLRKNIRGTSLNEDLNKIFAKRYGKDLVMTLFRGDTSLAADTRKNKALRCRDGFVAKALADADVHDVVINSEDYVGEVFPDMMDALPSDYRDQRDELAFFVSANVNDGYARQIGARQTAGGDLVLFGGAGNRKYHKYLDIDVIPVFGMNHDGNEYIMLTLKENLVAGFGQDMEIGRDVYNRQRKVEVTITAEFDNTILVPDAVALGSPA